MAAGIYQITNQVNGKKYIGSAANLQQRWWAHQSALRLQKHHNRYLQRAFDKHGEEAFVFSMLEKVESAMLLKREQQYLDMLKPEYNISPTARSPLGIRRSAETRRKLAKAQSGKHPSRETRKKMSTALRGRQGHFTGHHHSPLARRKISKALAGWHPGIETRRNMSEAQKKSWRTMRATKGEHMNFGDKLRTLRGTRNLSQAQVAEMALTSRVFISYLETGKMLPSPDLEARLRKALDWTDLEEKAFDILSRETEPAE